jgi:hypothetical protein
MDALTLIVTALISGTAASAKETASQAVKDAYNELKTLIHNKLVGKPVAEMALAQYETKPDVWKAPLEDGLKEAGVAQDTAIVEAARRLMTVVQPQQAAQGKYNMQIAGDVQGLAQGDFQRVNMSFGVGPEKKRREGED